jgi:hypothetical protein
MNWSALLSVLLAARIWKNLPLLFLLISGYAITYEKGNYETILIALFTLSFSSAFMTHLNIITDKELDAIKKPDLYKLLSQDKKITKTVLIAEAAAVVFGLVLLLMVRAYMPALFIFIFTCAAILYSYNLFTPSNAVKNRLKIYWWGHFLMLMIGYFSLWLAGYYCGEPVASSYDIKLLFSIFFLVSLSEYSLFLVESSVDSIEEKNHSLKTAVALLGDTKASLLAILMCMLSLIGLFYMKAQADEKLQLWIAVAFAPGIIIRLLVEITIVLIRSANLNYLWRLKVPDIIFNGTRLYTLITLFMLKNL